MSLYLPHCIKAIKQEAFQAEIRNKEMSLYDSIDSYDPDFYYLEAGMISQDCLNFMKDEKKVTFLIGISDLLDKHVQSLDNIIKEFNVNCKLFITNKFNHVSNVKTKKNKKNIFRLMEGYDDGLSKSNIPCPDYSFSKFIYSDEPHGKTTEPTEGNSVFHRISCIPQKNPKIDISLNCMLTSQLIKNYKEGIVYIKDYIPQIFFHSVMNNEKTSFYSDSEKSEQTINVIIRKIFDLDEKTSMIFKENNCNQEQIRKSILEKHTSINRVGRLLSQLN